MVARKEQIAMIDETLTIKKSSFVAFTGRRRVGKTFLIDQKYSSKMCLSVTGIQGISSRKQISNFINKLEEHSKQAVLSKPTNWQDAFVLLKSYLQKLPKNRKQVIFIDELPWMCNAKNGLLQLLAHLWNDYLSKEKHFILVICGSATAWITQKIINDKGGLHNRITHSIHLKPFTLAETKEFFIERKMTLTNNAIAEIYMTMGGIPFYLENIKRGESPTKAIERMCFSDNGLLKNEYQNLYKALFNYPENHEAIVSALAFSNSGISREELIKKSKVQAGGPFTRAMTDLLLSGFVVEDAPNGKRKKGSLYRLVDEFSVFHHRFIKKNKKAGKDVWQTIATSQAYKIWKGFAFETLCKKHIQEIKNALGIKNVYTKTNSFSYKHEKDSFQIDLLIDRNDSTINLCECKFYDAPFEIDKKYAMQLLTRRSLFKIATKTRKNVFNTMITNHPMKQNAYSLDCVDNHLTINELF